MKTRADKTQSVADLLWKIRNFSIAHRCIGVNDLLTLLTKSYQLCQLLGSQKIYASRFKRDRDNSDLPVWQIHIDPCDQNMKNWTDSQIIDWLR